MESTSSVGNQQQLANIYAGAIVPMKPFELARVQVDVAFKGAEWVESAVGRFAQLSKEQLVEMGYGEQIAKIENAMEQIESVSSPRNQVVQSAATYAAVPFAGVGLVNGIAIGAGAAEAILGTGVVGVVGAGLIGPVTGLLVAGGSAYIVYKASTLAGNAAFATGEAVLNLGGAITSATTNKIASLYTYYFVAQKAEEKPAALLENGSAGDQSPQAYRVNPNYGMTEDTNLD